MKITDATRAQDQNTCINPSRLVNHVVNWSIIMLKGLVSYKDATKIVILSFISMIFEQKFSVIDLFRIRFLFLLIINICVGKAGQSHILDANEQPPCFQR